MVRAHAPGSVTGLFAPAVGDRSEPSRGASVAIEDGVVVDLRPAETTEITVGGSQVPFEAVERVLSRLDVRAAVDVQPAVPLGHGFGASGAATLATALAAGEQFDLDHSRSDLLAAAHEAELAAGTGQGDVFIQERGGLLWSSGDGIERVTVDGVLSWESVGGIDTPEMLADEDRMARMSEHGRRHLDALDDSLTLRSFAERSRAFLDDVGIATSFVSDRLAAVYDAGGAGSMALFGDTVFAVDADGVLPNETRISNEGAKVI